MTDSSGPYPKITDLNAYKSEAIKRWIDEDRLDAREVYDFESRNRRRLDLMVWIERRLGWRLKLAS